MNYSARDLILNATYTLFRDGQVDATSQYFAPDYVVHLTDQDVQGGTSLVRSVVDLYRGAFPDLSVEVQFFLDSSDTVNWQRTMRATHTGSFKGFPGTGQPIIWREMVVSRFSGTLIAEEWVVTELAERLLLARKSLSRSLQKPKRQGGDA
ncbi:ester cyclase [Paucibacter sp. AS339]|uniref:ester cyclase n=1 Tax=Paucibacter hankyongi TaxID=3133434 RepID=UPI0030A75336